MTHDQLPFDDCDLCMFHESAGSKRVTDPLIACGAEPIIPAEHPLPETYDPFICQDGSLIAKAQVCDGIIDCSDEEDEAHCNDICSRSGQTCFSSCVQPHCICDDQYYMCDGGGCLHYDKLCDGKPDCDMADDESDCFAGETILSPDSSHFINIPEDSYALKCKSGDQVYDETAICRYDTIGDKMIHCEDGTHLGSLGVCMDFACFQSFKCMHSYCIPIRKICDGVIDCPNQEDENKCEHYTCPGQLQCTDQTFCVPRWELCDGTKHCPHGDDEKYCQICPEGCSCIGSVITCNHVQQSSPIILFQSPAALLLTNSTEVYAIISVNNVTYHHVFSFHLVEAQCLSIQKFSSDIFPELKVLCLVKLGIVKVAEHFFDGVHVKNLNLSFNKIYSIDYGAFDSMMNVKIISLASNAITYLKWYFCHKLEKLEHLDISNNPLTDVAASAFAHNPSLKYIISNWYMVCCVALQTTVHTCIPQDDGVSSCRNLLDSILQLLVIQVQTLAIIVGNVAALILQKISQQKPEAPLVYSLTGADLLMGVYLCIIVSVSFLYRDSFYTIISSRTKNPLCFFLSIVNFLSSECSLLMLTMLSVVRFKYIDLVGGLRGMGKKILVSVIFLWVVSAMFGLSYLGFLALADLKIRNNMCVLIVILHRQNVNNVEYYFQVIYVVFNLLCLLVIFASSVGLFNAVMKSAQSLHNFRAHAETSRGKKLNSKTVKVGSRMVVLLGCNAVCWIPVLIVSSLVLAGVQIQEQLLQWMVILVIPLGATLDPLLYNSHLFKNCLKRMTCKQ